MDLKTQPIDIFLLQLTYLPFEDVKAVCSSSKKLFDYCTNPKYNKNWKKIIDDTYKNVDDYDGKLLEIWNKFNLPINTYNYKVYTQLINVLDIITQHMIWYKQGDMKSFNKIADKNPRYLALYLLGEGDTLEKIKNNYYILMLIKEKSLTQSGKDDLLLLFSRYGNFRGVKKMIQEGANAGTVESLALVYAADNKNLRMADFLISNGASIPMAEFSAAIRNMNDAAKFLEMMIM